MMWVTMATGDYGNTAACLTTPDATETHQSDKCREMSLIGGSCMHLCVAGAAQHAVSSLERGPMFRASLAAGLTVCFYNDTVANLFL